MFPTEIAAILKAIHAHEDFVAARQKVVQVIEQPRRLRPTKAVELVETALEEALTYYAFRGTTSPNERILHKLRRRLSTRHIPARTVGAQSPRPGSR
jgi:hypothetical protein